jgi:EAL domain-containing protein (putative c-di-GMP-specific phosphodiesterase class I)
LAASILERVRQKGVRIALDDFGTGYSSRSYLRRFSVDSLTIDQSFVGLHRHLGDGYIIFTAVIGIARISRCVQVAQGVETLAQLEFLQAQACDETQGYFNRPRAADRSGELLGTGFRMTPRPAARPLVGIGAACA